MDEMTYKILMGASAFMVAMLGGMLATTTIQLENGLEKLRKARNILVPSYFVLALLSVVCCFTGYDPHVEPASTLFVASYQALLFTMSMMVFIRPAEVRWKTVGKQAGGITVAGVILFGAMMFTDYFSWFFYAGLVAYIAQLFFYTRKFMQAYRKTIQEVEDYYDDDEENRLTWAKTGFYSALVIGIMAITIMFRPGLYMLFVPLYVAFYGFIVMWFINYYHKMKFAFPVIAVPQDSADATNRVCTVATIVPETVFEETGNATIAPDTGEEAIVLEDIPETGKSVRRIAENPDESSCSEAKQLLEERLQKYIDEKEYCQKDVPSSIVVDSFGVNQTFFRQYMKDHYGMDLRPWRKELRLREAARLFAEHPEYSIDKVCEMVGYNDNGNFNRDFKKMMGMTPKCYCQQICLNSTVSPHEERVIFNDNPQ